MGGHPPTISHSRQIRLTVTEFSGGTVDFIRTRFSGSDIWFTEAAFSGSEVEFRHAVFSRAACTVPQSITRTCSSASRASSTWANPSQVDSAQRA
jgi:hypothetical protein